MAEAQVDSSLARVFTSIVNILEQGSLEKLKQFGGRKDAVLEKRENAYDFSYDHWICMVLVTSAPGFKISLKCHFSTNASRDLAATVMGKTDLTPEECHAFIGEYCNLVSGQIKTTLSTIVPKEVSKIQPAAMTLPKKIASIEDPSPSSKTDTAPLNDGKAVWVISWPKCHIAFSAQIELDRERILKNISNLEQLIHDIESFKVSDTGEIEWF